MKNGCNSLKEGNSFWVKVSSGVVDATGITDDEKVEISSRADGSIIIRKKERYIAFGVLHRYANPEPIPFEGGAFWIAMEEK